MVFAQLPPEVGDSRLDFGDMADVPQELLLSLVVLAKLQLRRVQLSPKTIQHLLLSSSIEAARGGQLRRAPLPLPVALQLPLEVADARLQHLAAPLDRPASPRRPRPDGLVAVPSGELERPLAFLDLQEGHDYQETSELDELVPADHSSALSVEDVCKPFA